MKAEVTIEEAISILLAVAVASGLALIAMGILLHHEEAQSEDYAPRSLVDWLSYNVKQGSGRGMISLGIFLISVTPLVRTALSLAWFTISKDYLYVLIAGAITALLLLAVLGYISFL